MDAELLNGKQTGTRNIGIPPAKYLTAKHRDKKAGITKKRRQKTREEKKKLERRKRTG